MRGLLAAVLAATAISSCATFATSSFEGELILLPDGCQQIDKRICRLGAPLRYTSPDGSLVWQADQWMDGNGQSGTTDGASIPSWAQPIIGDPYDESYLKAAIIHDHYCYEENRVRSWRQTHRMFYDALIDLRVDKSKAKIMYFAVYLGGPKWVRLVPGENCGDNCIKVAAPTRIRWEGDRFATPAFEAALRDAISIIEANPDIRLAELERRAEEETPDNFFFAHGATYAPNGPEDANMLPRE